MPTKGQIQKLRLLYLARIFEEQTDEEHGLTGPQLVEALTMLGVKVERKTVYDDIKCLIAFGYDIQLYQRSKKEYGLASRRFQDAELMLMADAVQSSKFLTEKKSEELVRGIGELGSRFMADELVKKVHVEGRIRNLNESVFYNLDAIQRAMTAKRKVEFEYFKYDENKRAVKQDKRYVETPVQLMYMDDFYYLVVWNDKYEDFTNYRVDRMRSIEVSSEEAAHNDDIAKFDVAKYQQRVFGMFNGEPMAVTLSVKGSVMSSVIDRFGKDVLVTKHEDGYATVAVTVMEAPTFWGWLAQFNGDISIEGPQKCKDKYAEYLRKLLAGCIGDRD